MTSPAHDDPYHALGLTKDATAAAIKTAYRKLVLKHHPDKVQDEALKQTAADLFHKIQSAWEKIGDEDKRSRYDAKCHLDALRKEAERDRQYAGTRPSPRSADSYSFPTSRGPEREAYRTEEIRPPGADYHSERPLDRRDFEVMSERPRRTPPRDDRRPKLSRQETKELERQRQREKVRQTTKATARDRDYKYAYSQPDMGSSSESDHFAEQRRSPRSGDDRRAADRYSEQMRRKTEDTARYPAEERMQRRYEEARDHIERSTRRQHSEPLRRASPPRVSSRDHTEYMKDSSGRPVQFRRGSGRPKLSREDSDASRRSRREPERSSGEYDDHPRRPPGLSQAKSAPHDIHMPYDKPRANSAQLTSEQMREFIPAPLDRANSMPLQGSRREETRSKPPRSSTLRQTQLSEDYDDIRKSSKSYFPSKSSKEYADDYEKPTPDGYVIETREPSRRTNRSPEREKSRLSSSRHANGAPPLSLNTRTTSYQYSPTAQGVEVLPSRPKLRRESSAFKDSYPLYGEITTPASPRDRQPHSASDAKYQEFKPDYKMHSGRSSRRPSETRSPSYYRANSFNTQIPA